MNNLTLSTLKTFLVKNNYLNKDGVDCPLVNIEEADLEITFPVNEKIKLSVLTDVSDLRSKIQEYYLARGFVHVEREKFEFFHRGLDQVLVFIGFGGDGSYLPVNVEYSKNTELYDHESTIAAQARFNTKN